MTDRVRGFATMDRLGLIDYVLLPLRWLEKSKGWKRRGISILYLVIFTVVSVLSYRELYLWRLPNLREPFDEAKYRTVQVPDSENAYPLFVEASKLLKPSSAEMNVLPFSKWSFNDWSKVPEPLRRWLEESRPALDLWLKAAEREEFLFVQPNQFRYSTGMDSITAIRELARLGLFEAARRGDSGDLEGAWRYYRGALRSSRLVERHGGATQRIIGWAILTNARSPVHVWIEDPAMTSAMLKRAIRDVEAANRLSVPVSEMIMVEYYGAKEILDHPERWKNEAAWSKSESGENWYVQEPRIAWLRHFVKREPERSQRVLRLIVAGLLAQSDRPRWARPKLYSEQCMIYEIDARTPPAVASISPEALKDWAENSGYPCVELSFLNGLMARFDSEVTIFDGFRLRMAERAYEIDHGQPAKTYGDLLGEYLKNLPEGIEPIDALGPPTPAQ